MNTHDKTLINARKILEQKYSKLSIPIKRSTYIQSFNLSVAQHVIRRKKYFGINVSFRNNVKWPLSFLPMIIDSKALQARNIKDKPPVLVLHTSLTYISHMITELDKYGIIKLEVFKKKNIFLDDIGNCSYLFNSTYINGSALTGKAHASSELFMHLLFDLFINTADIEEQKNSDLYDSQLSRLNEINKFYYNEMNGKFLDWINKEFFRDFYKMNKEFLSLEDHDNKKKKYALNNIAKYGKLFFKSKDSPKTLIKKLRGLSEVELVTLLVTFRRFSFKTSLVVMLYCILNKKNSEYAHGAMHGLIYRQYLAINFKPKSRLLKKERESWNINLEKGFENFNNLYMAQMNFLDLYLFESDERYIETLIRSGESVTNEFKATLKYSVRQKKDDKYLYHETLRAICALANTDGGTVLVGYDDDQNNFVGIERDGFKNKEIWENYLQSRIDEDSGKILCSLIKIEFKSYKEITLAVINVTPAKKHVLCRDPRNKKTQHFYVRTGPSTRALDLDEGIEYIQKRFSDND